MPRQVPAVVSLNASRYLERLRSIQVAYAIDPGVLESFLRLAPEIREKYLTEAGFQPEEHERFCRELPIAENFREIGKYVMLGTAITNFINSQDYTEWEFRTGSPKNGFRNPRPASTIPLRA